MRQPGGFARHRMMSVREVRDLIGLLLVIIGAIGLVVTAWIWDPLAGVAALFVAIIAGGIALGTDW